MTLKEWIYQKTGFCLIHSWTTIGCIKQGVLVAHDDDIPHGMFKIYEDECKCCGLRRIRESKGSLL